MEKGRISRQAFHILDDELAGSCCSAAGRNFYFEENLKEKKKKVVVWRIRGHLFFLGNSVDREASDYFPPFIAMDDTSFSTLDLRVIRS